MRAPLLLWTLVLTNQVLASGFLTLETSPAGIEIWYSQPGSTQMKYLGDSPLDKREMPPGTYNLWLIQGGKDTVAISGVSITEGQHTRVTHEMPANYGSLRVVTDPDSEEIWLDGVKLGNSPYYNNLVLPGTYSLKLVPREALYRTYVEKLGVKKGDSLDLHRPLSFRDKSFFEENLSARPWAVQLEGGYQYGSAYGAFDTSGKRVSDTLKGKQNDFPLTLRLGLPYGLEIHGQLPFHSFTPKDSAPLPRDPVFGLKYTLRPYGIGLDASYSIGSSHKNGGFNHDRLMLTALGVYAMNKVLIQGNGGYEFHFADKDSSKLNPGDALFLNARVGYAADAFLPYLAVHARFQLDGSQGNATVTGGDAIGLEPGLVYDFADAFSMQLGIPFTVFGKNASEYWALNISVAIRFGLL